MAGKRVNFIDVITKVRGKKALKNRKGNTNIFILTPPASLLGNTGAGPNGVVEPGKPTDLINTVAGPRLLHEGENVSQNVDGTLNVTPANRSMLLNRERGRVPELNRPVTPQVQSNLTEMQNRGMPGFQIGGRNIRTTPNPRQTFRNIVEQGQQTTQQAADTASNLARATGAVVTGQGTQTPGTPQAVTGQVATPTITPPGIPRTPRQDFAPTTIGGPTRPTEVTRTFRAPEPTTVTPGAVTPTVPAPTTDVEVPTITVEPPPPAAPPTTQADRAITEGLAGITDIARGESEVLDRIRQRELGEFGATSTAQISSNIQRLRASGASDAEINAMIAGTGRASDIARSKLAGSLALDASERAASAVRDLVTLGIGAETLNLSKQKYGDLEGQRLADDVAAGVPLSEINARRAQNGLPPVSQEDYDSLGVFRQQSIEQGQITIENARTMLENMQRTTAGQATASLFQRSLQAGVADWRDVEGVDERLQAQWEAEGRTGEFTDEWAQQQWNAATVSDTDAAVNAIKSTSWYTSKTPEEQSEFDPFFDWLQMMDVTGGVTWTLGEDGKIKTVKAADGTVLSSADPAKTPGDPDPEPTIQEEFADFQSDAADLGIATTFQEYSQLRNIFGDELTTDMYSKYSVPIRSLNEGQLSDLTNKEVELLMDLNTQGKIDFNEYFPTVQDSPFLLDNMTTFTRSGKNRWVLKPEVITWADQNVGKTFLFNGRLYKLDGYWNTDNRRGQVGYLIFRDVANDNVIKVNNASGKTEKGDRFKWPTTTNKPNITTPKAVS